MQKENTITARTGTIEEGSATRIALFSSVPQTRRAGPMFKFTSILIALLTAAVVNVLLSRKLDAMAYCGIGHNHATRKLLYTMVSHVNDAVQRTVLTPMELILLRSPEQCPWVVSLLVKSYNPHERYGAAMAFDIACAFSG
uniref:Uncharacterized protein n=1 Tax=Anopheles melas TaxID=34690 RepID=A0A182TIJ2_9DIPT